MLKTRFSFRTLGLGAAFAAVAALPASPAWASSTSSSSSCPNPLLTQPFSGWGDQNYYELMPGESPDSFAGAGWTLTGGASVVTTTLADGKTGSVLNLPSGSQAVSPTICVESNYPTLRTMVRNVAGAEGVHVYLSYEGTKTWNSPQDTGQVHGQQMSWTLSDPQNVQPSNQPGAQYVRFTLIPGGKTSDFQIYDFYVDPRMLW